MKRLVILAILFPISGFAQVTLLAHTAAGYGGSGNGTKPVTTAAIDTTGASMIAVCATGYANNTVAPIDSEGNTWRLANTQNEDGDARVSLWYAMDPKTNATHTFTARGQAPALAVMAFSNVASGPDQKSSSQGGRSPLTAGELTPAAEDELVISCIAVYLGAAMPSVSGPLKVVDAVPYAGGYSGSEATVSAYAVETRAAKVNPAWNFSGGSIGVATVADTFYSTLAPAPLAVATTGLPEAAAGSPYSVQLEESGGVGPFTWSLASGNLPSGLSLSTSGAIAGTPSAAAAVPLTFRVADSKGRTVTSPELTLTVASAALTVSARSCATTGKQYEAYAGCTIAAAGGTPPYTYAWTVVKNASLAALPEGLTLDPATGAITGTVYGQGSYLTQFEAKDSLGTMTKTKVTFGFAGDSASGGCSLFPADSAFHLNISSLPVDTSPAAPIYPAYQASRVRVFFGAGLGGWGSTPNGIPFIRVPHNQKPAPVKTTMYQSYFSSGPIPSYAPVETTSNSSDDRHVLVLETAGDGGNCSLWELWQAVYVGGAQEAWKDSSNANWMNLGGYAMPPQGKGTTDAAGLPVLPLLLTADEVIGTGTRSSPNGAVRHATRFTVNHMLNYYVWPANAHAGVGQCSGGYEDADHRLLQSKPPTSCTMSGPAGEIYRLKSSVPDPACAATSPQASIIIKGFRNYGIILADNGLTGGLIGTPDARWNDADLACLSKLNLGDFEPVDLSGVIVNASTSYQTKEKSGPEH